MYYSNNIEISKYSLGMFALDFSLPHKCYPSPLSLA